MPMLIVAIMDDADVPRVMNRFPLKIPLATREIDATELRTYPLESILECSIRPAAIAVINAWRDRRV